MNLNNKALLEELIALQKIRSENNLSTFFRGAWSVLEPDTELIYNWHHDVICEYLEATVKGDIKRLIINIPPRYGKSNLITVAFPAWVWVNNPQRRFMFTSYSASLSTKHSKDRRDLIESEWYQSFWGDRFKMATDQNVKTEYENDKRGHMIATSMSGSATGKGCNFLVVDDPHDTTKAHSDIKREGDIREFRQKFVSRLNDKKKDVIIIVMQRLHENDLVGSLKEADYTVLKLPAVFPKSTIIEYPISKKTRTIKEGEVLHPDREGIEQLEKIKADLGSRNYAGQYLQEPAPAEGNIIKRSWIKFYKTLPDVPLTYIQSWDLSFKGGEQSDFVSGQCWAKHSGKFFLIDRIKDRMDFPTALAAFKSFTAKHPKATRKLIEDKANGPAIIASLKTKIFGIIPVNPKDSKEARTHAIAPLFEAGNVYFPDPSIAPWIHDFIEEVVKFPMAKNDDDHDAMVQALNDFIGVPDPKILVVNSNLQDDDDDDY